jgi:2,4-diaminopentanoate dehydrogenase
MPYRVVQWTTGNVGRRAVRAIVARPDLELVGCYAWSADKVGVDVGTLVGIDPIGVTATDDINALLALKPDCVSYNPLWPNVDELVRILRAGVNVAATAGFITGHALGADRQRIIDACEAGGSSIFGSGMNPGFANLIGLVSAGLCDRVDKVTVLESVDSTGYDSPSTEMSVGFGSELDDPELPGKTRHGTLVFGDAVHLMADVLGIELDDVRCETAYARTTAELDLGSWSIAAGRVAGVEASWQGIVGDRAVIDLRVRWRKGRTLDPDWKVEHGYIVNVEGMPTVRTKVDVFPPADFVAKTFSDYMVLGMVMTAMPAVHAIPAICDAKPGIRTYADLPLITAHGLTR